MSARFGNKWGATAQPKGMPDGSSATRSVNADHPAGSNKPTSGTFARAPRSKPMVLAVDDSPLAVARLKELLTRAGYEVLSADNGTAALMMAREFRPDIVLLDIEMPGKTGIEVCQELKKDPRTWRQLVILMTASDEPAHLRDGFRAGCDGFIPKGTGDGALLRKLRVKLIPGTSVQGKR